MNGCVLFQESENSLYHLSMVKRETGKAGSTALTFIAYAEFFSFSSRDNFKVLCYLCNLDVPQEKKSPEKQSPRSRIPRPVLSPPSVPKGKRSPLPEHPFSEEEAKECDISSQHSKRTISPNSFSSGKALLFSL